jgi:copper transport protein
MAAAHRVRRFVLAVAGAAALSVLGAAPALAHNAFVGSDPVDGAVLVDAPRQLALDFGQDVALPLTRVSLADSQGHAVPLPDGALAVDPGRHTRLLVRLPALRHDAYRLTFSTRDGEDLHQTDGSMVFGVGVTPADAPAPVAASPPVPVEAATRLVSFAGLAALLGGLLLALLVLPRAVAPGQVLRAAQMRLLWLAMAGAAAVAAGETALLAVRAGGSDVGLGAVLQSGFGHRWAVNVAFAAGLAPLLWWLRRRAPAGGLPGLAAELRRDRGWAALSTTSRVCVLAAGQAVALAFSGHLGGDSSPTIAAVALRTVHLLAAGAWAGGLLGLVLVLARPGRPPAWPVVRALSPFAAVSFAAAAVSGLLLAGGEVASVTALLVTPYGVTLLLKVGLVAVAGLLGLRHAVAAARGRHDLAPAEVARPWPRTLVLEAAAALGILLLAGTLGSTPPATGRQFDPAPPPAPPSAVAVDTSDLIVRLAIEPNRPGRNLVAVSVINKRRPVAWPVTAVAVELRQPGQAAAVLAAQPAGAGSSSYDAGALSLASGDLAADVEIDRAGLPPTREHFAWSVRAAQPARHPVVLSDARIATVTNGLAAIVLAAALLAILVRWRRRRRGSTAAEPAAATRAELTALHTRR